jgi:hypothetical protein
MGDETKEIELTIEDVLFLRLHQEFANWCGVEAKDYRHWLNGLLPVEKDEIRLFKLREVEIECSCLLTSITESLGSRATEIDSYLGTALGELIRVLKISAFVYPSRKRQMHDGQSLFWAIRRYKDEAWFVEVRATEEERTKEMLRQMLG